MGDNIKILANLIYDIKDKITTQEFIEINKVMMVIFKDPSFIKKIYISENDCCENCCGCCLENAEEKAEWEHSSEEEDD